MSNQVYQTTSPSQLNPVLLNYNGIMSFVYTVIGLLYFISFFFSSSTSHPLIKFGVPFLSIISLILTIYLYYQFSKLILIKFDYDMRGFFYPLITLAIPFTILDFIESFTHIQIENYDDIIGIISMGILLFMAILYLVFGIKLFKAKINFSYLHIYSILMIAAGGLTITMCLAPFGFFIMIALDIIMGLTFLKVKHEMLTQNNPDAIS